MSESAENEVPLYTAREAQRLQARAFDEALSAVVRDVKSAMGAHREHGHRQIVAALSRLVTAVPRTENPYRVIPPGSSNAGDPSCR